ncbi:MAG TPA: Hsp20/alpha crystallin family protein [Polyangia bacterium]|nr:Hsp20/alpha crystallin family protein [Polyangia bacterium]
MANIVRKSEGSMTPGSSVLDPFDVMREMFSLDPLRHIFGTGALHHPAQTFVPQFEIRENNDGYVFKADLPGVQEEDLDISIAKNRLSVSGKREMEKREENDRYYAVERNYGSFTRTFTLPTDIDEAHVDAELRDGVLTLKVPKSREQQAKKVQIKTGGAGGGTKTAKAGSA